MRKHTETQIFINSISLQNFLSFGHAEKIKLNALNVFIGKNSSGKSNLIEAFGLLQALPKDLLGPIRRGGGIREWLWKGAEKTPVAEIDVALNCPMCPNPLLYRLNFTEVNQRLELVDEAIECIRNSQNARNETCFYYRYQEGNPVLNVRNISSDTAQRTERTLQREDLDVNQSVLSQRKDPDQYPELTYVGNNFSKIRLFREWNLGRYAPPRLPQHPDLPEDFLLEDMSNIGLVLNDLQHRPNIKKKIMENFNLFYDEFDDISTKIHGGTVQIYLHEESLNLFRPPGFLTERSGFFAFSLSCVTLNLRRLYVLKSLSSVCILIYYLILQNCWPTRRKEPNWLSQHIRIFLWMNSQKHSKQ